MQLKKLNNKNKQDFDPYIQQIRQEFIKNFLYYESWEGNIERCYQSPQWDGFLYALNASNPRSLSLDGVENPDKKWNSGGVHKKKYRKI